MSGVPVVADGAPVRVRDADEADLPAIVAIYNSTIPGRMVTADTEPVTPQSRLSWFRAHTRDAHPIWVVGDRPGGEVCAWISFSPFHPRPAYRPTAELSLYVAETHRRRGLGVFLARRAIERAPGLGLRTLVGLIWGHNEPSLRLFDGLGFGRWGRLPGVASLDGIERDLVIVGRRV
jgi:L-amino acid N-acyltransferase YncA